MRACSKVGFNRGFTTSTLTVCRFFKSLEERGEEWMMPGVGM